MKRLNTSELLQFLQCPYCGKKLQLTANSISCRDCEKQFGQFRDHPVIIRDENELFPPAIYVNAQSASPMKTRKKGRLHKIKALIPSKSVNVARERMFKKLSLEYGSQNKVILVVGCGNQLTQLQKYFPDNKTSFLFCDIDKQADVDIFCDAHELSFKDEVFDGVISTAMLEHVLYPERVIHELYRVLKKEGFIYSEIPFLQSVHEGAYDFTRYTLSGHRRLLENFKEIEAGMVAGPGTALVWSIVDFSKVLFKNQQLSNLSALAARSMFFWIKYFDFYLQDKNPSLNAASCTYFYGIRSLVKISSNEIIKKYQGQQYYHV